MLAGDYSFTVHLIWTYNRVLPVDTSCTDNASRALTLTVQTNTGTPPVNPNQTLAVDRPQIATTYHIGTFPPAADTVQVTSSAGPAAIAVQAATDSGGPWLSVTPQSGTTPTALSISYSVNGLTQGTPSESLQLPASSLAPRRCTPSPPRCKFSPILSLPPRWAPPTTCNSLPQEASARATAPRPASSMPVLSRPDSLSRLPDPPSSGSCRGLPCWQATTASQST